MNLRPRSRVNSGRAALALTLCLAPALAARAAAQDPETSYQLWPEGNVYVRLSDASRLYFLLATVRERGTETGELSKISDIQVGTHIEFGLVPFGRRAKLQALYDAHRLSYLRLRLGLRYQTRLDDDEPPRYEEWRGIVELTPRFTLPGDLLVAQRNRVDLRWINGDPSWRYRPRLWVEREIRVGSGVALVPYGAAEVYWDSRYDDWVRTKYQLGAAVMLTSRIAPEVYVALQRDEKPGRSYTRALGVVVALYF